MDVINQAATKSVFEFSDGNEYLSTALDLVQDAVVALDPQGHITYLNRAAEQLYGWTSLQITGRRARSVLFGNRKHGFDAAWRALRDAGQWNGQITQLTKDGERLIESRWSAMRDKRSSRITSILIVSTPAIDDSTAGLAHEIRNPLASIKGVADALLQRAQLSPQEREWMEAVRREVQKIDKRMRELLDVSQRRVFNIKPCLLSEVVSNVVVLASSQQTGKQISIKFVDETSEPLVVHIDIARIEDAVLNLVLNAIESIEKSGRVTVCLKQPANTDEALIEVCDTGCGIPLEIRRRIFEPRFTTKREGTGLGLAAVRRTAIAYHGRITFNTKIGRGSKFVLALPLRTQQTSMRIRNEGNRDL